MKRIRGKCDYCHKRRMIDKKTKFCRECAENFAQTVDKYFDGDPLEPLRIAASLAKEIS